MSAATIRDAVEWLIDGARSAPEAPDVLDELCRRLVEAGLPLWRVVVFVRTPHPQVMGRRFSWRAGAGVEMATAPHEIYDAPEFKGSPVDLVYQGAQPVRRRLLDPDCPIDHRILSELRAAGATDYLAVPLVFTDGQLHAATWATDAPQGFSDTHLAAIDAITRPLSRVAEIRAWRRTATNLLETYVGRRSGARILAGHIRRGDVETIEAAFWYSDLRDFTMLNETLPPPELLTLLNEYFEAVASTAGAQGGEVLQFIGDAALVIFPVGADGRRGACTAALAAARAALDAIATVNAGRAGDGKPAIRFGIGLHVGAVSWGNVGGVDRLGLNVIGPAVNRTARIESLTKQVGLPLLLSADFAAALDEPTRAVGCFPLKGVAEPQTVYAVDG
jgi:adenylate cyclase